MSEDRLFYLARRLEGSGVTANAIQQDLLKSGMGKTSGRLLRSVFRVVNLFGIPPEKGAQGVVNLAINPALEKVSGQFINGMKAVRSSPVSYECSTARKLWKASEKPTGVKDGGRAAGEQ